MYVSKLFNHDVNIQIQTNPNIHGLVPGGNIKVKLITYANDNNGIFVDDSFLNLEMLKYQNGSSGSNGN